VSPAIFDRQIHFRKILTADLAIADGPQSGRAKSKAADTPDRGWSPG
jgi:hypothetical protein